MLEFPVSSPTGMQQQTSANQARYRGDSGVVEISTKDQHITVWDTPKGPAQRRTH